MNTVASLYASYGGSGQLYPRLNGDIRADVIIVGAGVTGLSAALHLAENGVRVVVLEAEQPGWGLPAAMEGRLTLA